MLKKTLFDFTKTLLSLFRIVKNNRQERSILPKTTHRDIIILGTGPSLKDTLKEHIDEIKRYDIMTLNKFCTRPEFTVLKSKHYLLLDADFSTKVMADKDIEVRDEVFEALLEKTSWKMNLYFPSNTDMRMEIDSYFSKNTYINIVYFHMTTIEGLDSINFKLYEHGQGMPFAGNVIVSAILLSLNIGYKRIGLFGADLSMHAQATVNLKNQLCLGELNYYENRLQGEAQNETVFEYYFKTARTFEAFHSLKRYADYKQAKIYNGSMDSFIDAFEKRELKELLIDIII